MRTLVSTLAALALSTAALAQDIAPPVQQKPADAAGARAPEAAAPADGQRTTPARDIQDYQAELAALAAESGSDEALDGSLVRVMSSLAGAGRCGDAAGLARREGRQELATRVEQLCE